MLRVDVGPSSWHDSPHITDSGIVGWLWEQQLGRAPTCEELEEFVTTFEAALAHDLRSAPDRFRAVLGAAELLAHLEESGWTLAIATGGWSRTARLKLEAAGLSSERLLASSDDSPDRAEIFRLAESRAAAAVGAPLHRTVLVGDGTWDVRVASHFGWPFVGVGQGRRATRLMNAGATVVIADFANPVEVERILMECEEPLSN
jgi:phosphoglycolate phosphatase-like HAD superfamily hydrolase